MQLDVQTLIVAMLAHVFAPAGIAAST